jgi:SAM-dependent methyltransferase
MASKARSESNAWLRERTTHIAGAVLSVGSGDDRDGEGAHYRDYFKACSRYITSDVVSNPECELVLDVRAMPEIVDASFDCIFCSGVLEHVDDYQSALAERTRILKPGGTLLLGLPFRQAIHMAPIDYWRFTAFAVRHLLEKHGYLIDDIRAIDDNADEFPAAYWAHARKAKNDAP